MERIQLSESNIAPTSLIELTADITAAYVGNNSVPPGELTSLIKGVFGALAGVGAAPADIAVAPQTPAVAVKKSITDEYLICLEDGRKFKSLKRHLRTKYNLSPDEYRSKWDLPKTYPMVAPAYAAARSLLAKQMGLGNGGRQAKAKRAPAKRGAAK